MKKIHFIAIGGAAMHNLAIALHKNGNIITGSDDNIFDPALSNLKKYGLMPEKEGWFVEKINSNIDIVILGMHARKDKPEHIKAQNLGLNILSFPEFIYQHSIEKTRIVVGGSHGKTTITGMIIHVLNKLNINVDYLLGASVIGVDGNVKLSDNAKFMVIEGDEYLTSPINSCPKFHVYKPHIAIISGIAWDHINVFKTFEIYKEQFQIFTKLIEPKGKLIYCADDKNVVEVANKTSNNINKIPYSLPKHIIKNGITYLISNDNLFPLKVFGNHNLLNIESARLVCEAIGVSSNDFYKHISTWEGAYNRLSKVYSNNNLTIFRDFAHAPSKVDATIDAVRKQYPKSIIVACLELHTFSSLSKEFLPNYKNSLNNIDIPILFYNKHAVELKKLEMPTPDYVKECFNNNKIEIFNNSKELENELKSIILNKNNNIVLLMMSSGNFDNLDIVGLTE